MYKTIWASWYDDGRSNKLLSVGNIFTLLISAAAPKPNLTISKAAIGISLNYLNDEKYRSLKINTQIITVGSKWIIPLTNKESKSKVHF